MRCRVKKTTRISANAVKKTEVKPLEMSDDSVGREGKGIKGRGRVTLGVKMMTWICQISVVCMKMILFVRNCGERDETVTQIGVYII